MSRLRAYVSLILMLSACFGWNPLQAQKVIHGIVQSQSEIGVQALSGAEIRVIGQKTTAFSNSSGHFELNTEGVGSTIKIRVFLHGYQQRKLSIDLPSNEPLAILLKPLSNDIKEILIRASNYRADMKRLNAVEGTHIYASKKNEVILLDNVSANKAANRARQIYAKVPGLNIWQSDGAGLQLDIGARGLSPTRSSNFNTRQNGADMSADALGYPESYYSPLAEGVERIEMVRGAASLQYGTQFGGLLNFKMKKGATDKKIELVQRLSTGSFGLVSNFTSLGGTVGRVNYYGFYGFKRMNGWRDNSSLHQHNAYFSSRITASDRLTIGFSVTHMNYLSQQAGGLTDALFEQNARQSIRDRNWFRVNWNLASVDFEYKLSRRSQLHSQFFGLLGSRDALGVLDFINRPDHLQERDLLEDDYLNVGNETRLITKYLDSKIKGAFLTGFRFYTGSTDRLQTLSDDASDSSFEATDSQRDGYSKFNFPSHNVAWFAENVLYISDRFSITPGVRLEWINTAANGSFRQQEFDLAGNVISDTLLFDAQKRSRTVLLAGLGMSYKTKARNELYFNISRNYRAVNFNDLRVTNPNLVVDSDLQDERGFNTESGIRGKAFNQALNFDLSAFFLLYRDKIGTIVKSEDLRTFRFRSNLSDSRNFGIEAFAEVNWMKIHAESAREHQLIQFINLGVTDARYFNTKDRSILNKQVENVALIQFKSGLRYRYRNFSSSIQMAFTTEQFADATNARYAASATSGVIPAYYVLDFSLDYSWRWLTFEAGINNLTDHRYFTRRADGYPGPGILPADGISAYGAVQFKIGK